VGVMLSLSPDGTVVSLKWENKTLDCHHGGVVRAGDYIYGASWEGNTGGKGKLWACIGRNLLDSN